MKSNPEITIAVCTYNREKFLTGSLNSLVKQTLTPDRFEILIVNNNSTDGTESISKNFISSNQKLNVKYFVETQKGLSAARNRSIKESTAELIVFIDDDAEATKNYLETAVESFNEYPEISAMGGKIIPVFETGNEPVWLSKPLWGLVTKADWGENIGKYPYSKFPYGCSMAFRKSVLYEIGLFNLDLEFRSEDKYIFRRLEQLGKKFIYNPKFVVYHHIDAKRVTYESINKMSLGVGAGERDRLRKSGTIKNVIKVIEYILKFIAAVVIALGFLFKFEFKKAEYIVKNRLYTLLGYFYSGN